MRVAQYRKNNHASIYFCDTRFFRGVMLRGTMEVLTDDASKEMIWQEGDTMYYPEGVTDPDYCVLKFTAISGRFYSNFKSESFVGLIIRWLYLPNAKLVFFVLLFVHFVAIVLVDIA